MLLFFALPIVPIKATNHTKTCDTLILINYTHAPTICIFCHARSLNNRALSQTMFRLKSAELTGYRTWERFSCTMPYVVQCMYILCRMIYDELHVEITEVLLGSRSQIPEGACMIALRRLFHLAKFLLFNDFRP